MGPSGPHVETGTVAGRSKSPPPPATRTVGNPDKPTVKLRHLAASAVGLKTTWTVRVRLEADGGPKSTESRDENEGKLWSWGGGKKQGRPTSLSGSEVLHSKEALAGNSPLGHLALGKRGTAGDHPVF